MNPIFVNNGDTIAVIAKTPITVSDPADQYPYVSKAFRVVADRYGNTLVLVSLGTSTRISENEVAEAKDRIKKNEAHEQIGKALPIIIELLVRRATWDEQNSQWKINLTPEEFKQLAGRAHDLKSWFRISE